MEIKNMLRTILYLYNELIFIINKNTKMIVTVNKGEKEIARDITIDEFCTIFANTFKLIDSFRFKLTKFLTNLEPPSTPFTLTIGYTQLDGNPINIKYKGLKLDEEYLLFSLSSNVEENRTKLDDLTKCYTKSYMIKEIEDAIKEKKEFALMIVDIDNFKTFNEKYGRMFGDMILIEVAAAIKAYVGKEGFVARLGGDEFLVLLYTKDNYDNIHNVCTELRNSITSLNGSNIKNAKLTATVGCASHPNDGDTPELLLKKTEAALERGKKKGKNCFIIYLAHKCGEVTIDNEIITEDKELESNNSSVTNYNVISGIIEILNRRVNLKTDFKDSLSLIGNYFMLDRISVIFLNPETYEFEDQLIWNSPLLPPTPLTSSKSNIPNWKKSYDQTKMLKINQVSSNKDLAIYEQLKKEKTSAILAFELIYDGKVYGQARYDMIYSNRFWQPTDVSALSLISKTFAIKLSTEYANRMHFEDLYVDKLTKLYNFSKWIIDIEDYLYSNKNPYTIITFNICDFQSLISILGTKECDKIIIEISKWLKQNCDEYCCRVRGEMFAVLTNDIEKDEIKGKINSLNNYLLSSYEVKSATIRLKYGIYTSYNNSETTKSSVDKALLALNSNIYNDGIVFYTDELYDEIKEQTTLELHIEDALENNEFLLYIQPKISTKTGKIAAAEALTRWNYRFEKILPPFKFIPLFERTGYITRLDYNVFENVCKFLRNIIDNNEIPVPISVNVSRYTRDYENYVKTLNSIREKYNIDASLIELEITEGMYTENAEDIKRFVNMLRKEGYAISIDDFGSGYSNLNNIANLDFEVLKLDKSLCNMIDKRGELILNAVISTAKKTGHTIVCEGVETKEICEKLKDMGADLIQGYYYDKPLEKNEFRTKYITKKE